MKKFIEKNFIVILLIIFLGTTSFLLAKKVEKYENPLKGTYVYMESPMKQEYLALGRNQFYYYNQDVDIDLGKYKQVYKDAYALKGEKSIEGYVIKNVIDNQEVLYVHFNQDNLKVFVKVTDNISIIGREDSNLDIKE